MAKRVPPGRVGRVVARRVEKKGLRPRVAASVIVVAWTIGVVVFGILERLVDPDTYDNIWIAMWTGIQTVTTVGYGDVVPGNTAGKVVAAFLMMGGLSLFAVVTGAITSAFVTQAQAQQGNDEADPVAERLDEMSARLEAVQADLARLEQPPD